MPKYKGFIKKSRTLDTAALIAILSAMQPYISQLDLPANAIQIIGMAFAGYIAYLRKTTTGKVGEK